MVTSVVAKDQGPLYIHSHLTSHSPVCGKSPVYIRDMCLKEATGLPAEMATENALFAENKTRSIYFSFRVSRSLVSKISSSVENVTCIETVAIWLLLHLPAVAGCCGCPLRCAFEHLSYRFKSKGWGHPRGQAHVWLEHPASTAKATVVSSTFNIHFVFKHQFAALQPMGRYCRLSPRQAQPLPVPDPQATGCSRGYGLSVPPSSFER